MSDIKTVLPSELVAAYEATNFEVNYETPFVLKVGTFSKDLQSMLSKLNHNTGCFITAYNPESIEKTLVENESSQEKLYSDLSALDCKIFCGFGADPDGNWEGEPSYFAIGISKENAQRLGKKYRQNAIVWCDERCIPELLLLR